MKKWLLFVVLFATLAVHARHDCLDTSRHLKQAFDTKAEHYVGCTCPCNQYPQSGRNKCLQCKHTHHADRYEILDATVQGNQKASQSMAHYADVPEVLNTMISIYRQGR